MMHVHFHKHKVHMRAVTWDEVSVGLSLRGIQGDSFLMNARSRGVGVRCSQDRIRS